MAITLNGTSGISTPGLTNTGTGTLVGLTTTGNTILGDASTDTLNVGNGGLVKDASGNVGIGTSSPAQKLHVVGAVNATTFLNLGGNTSAPAVDAAIYRPADGTLAFVANASERMRIDSAGNVGIGTSSPTAVLQIASDATGTDFQSASSKAGIALNFNGSGISYYDSDTFIFRESVGSGSEEKMRINSSGNLLVGATTTPNATYKQIAVIGATTNRSVLTLGRATAATTGVCGSIQSFNGSNGCSSIDFYSTGATNSGAVIVYTFNAGTQVAGPYVTNGGTSWTTSSDESLKTVTGEITNALYKISKIRAIEFTWKADNSNKQNVGFIAQEVQTVLPEVIDTDTNGHLGVRYAEVTTLLVASIKELKAIIDTQNDTINNLTTRLETLEGAV